MKRNIKKKYMWDGFLKIKIQLKKNNSHFEYLILERTFLFFSPFSKIGGGVTLNYEALYARLFTFFENLFAISLRN